MKSTQNRSQVIKSGPKEGTLKSIPTFSNNVPVIITKAVCNHTGTCDPCSQQQMIVRQRSGQYVAKLSIDTIYTLCSMYTQFGILKSNIVKPYLQTAFPRNKNATKHNIWSLKRKIKEISKEVGTLDDFVTFEAKFKSSNLEVGIEDMSSYDDDVAEIGQEMWKDLMNEKSGEDTFCTFFEYMQLMKQNNKGFQYQFLENNVGTITGCVWQTAVMRDNFERFGGYICIDAMKRHINTLDWPYISVVMNNELNNVCVACEAILFAERIEGYKSIINFILKNTNKRTKEDIYVLAADGIMEQSIVKQTLDLPNAVYMTDAYHLFNSTLPKRFGPEVYSLIEAKLKKMCYSKVESIFEDSFQRAMNLLNESGRHNANLEDQLTNVLQ